MADLLTRDPDPTSPQIAVVTCLRDEGPYVVEWVAHLRRLGVTRILAFTNDCSDGTEDVLDALAPAGVTHVRQGAVRHLQGRTPQWRALQAAWDHPALDGAQWLLHLDVDEWIALDGPRDLPGLIYRCGPAQAIALPWRLFGNAGRVEAGQGIVPERFAMAAPEAMVFPALGSFFKTLFRRDGPFTGFGVHRPKQSAPPVFADDTGRPDADLASNAGRIMLWRGGTRVPDRLVQANHYSTRSINEFLVKRLRGLPNRTDKSIDLTYWIERNFNAVRCDMIADQIPGILSELSDLRGLPGVVAAEEVARGWHAEQLAGVLATVDGAHLCGRLVLAGSSVAPDAGLGRKMLAHYQAAQRGQR